MSQEPSPNPSSQRKDIPEDSPSSGTVTPGEDELQNEKITKQDSDSEDQSPRSTRNPLLWAPPWCRWDPKNPPKFNVWINILFAFAGTFTVANLYYAQPLLDELAQYFGVTHERASLVPTCSQAGYATGLIFLCPLGDLLRRRPFVLSLMFMTATLWIGICITRSFNVFLAITYLSSITTVTPQVMLPLVGDLAPANRRATALSIVSSGLVLGLLFARLLSGIVAQYSTWRTIYWLALALQYTIVFLLWLFMPDYPQTNKGLSYPRMLVSIVRYLFTEPVLVQAASMNFFLSATFTSFWTTLTFLLSGRYNYSTITIGLYSLAGLTPMIMGPFFGRYVIDKFVVTVSLLICLTIVITGICIGTYTGTITAAGPVLQSALQDFGLQMSQVANRAAIYSIDPKSRSRLNTTFTFVSFCGQLMGTAVGNRVYDQSGWIVSGSVSVAFAGAAFLICLARGPAQKGWLGWSEGIRIRKPDVQT
ncbi:hypothetical protein N7495_006766 [Penicillium taxi]|uniref:uncharacterized protein n=1 Tax=Penicillium taxi TaxID=168475 RepID=UPI002545289F|nr:uncharacterized protein N7495_006766 [Penicillium taxi]KAJ5895075.1 hypothetical protein N7495_006766 [Penicillium taxi]